MFDKHATIGFAAVSLALISLFSNGAWSNGDTRLISNQPTGTLGEINDCDTPDISADSRFITYVCGESYTDENGATYANFGVYVTDRVTSETTLVSLKEDGSQLYGFYNIQPGISADGRFVTFTSMAQLSDKDTNIFFDVYVHDRLTRKTELVSLNSNGFAGNRASYSSSLSSDGRFVVFESAATNLVKNDSNNYPDIFIHDRLRHQTRRVNLASDGSQADKGNHPWPVLGEKPEISDNGRFIAFASEATNLVPNDTNGLRDIFIHDRHQRTTTRVSVDSGGEQSNGASDQPSLSGNGRFVAFQSTATNLAQGITVLYVNVLVNDRLTGQTTLISDPQLGGIQPNISTNGRHVSYMTLFKDWLPNGVWNVTVHDRVTKQAAIVSRDNLGGYGNQWDLFGYSWNYYPKINATGRYAVFASIVTLNPEDTDGIQSDIYLRDLFLNNGLQGDLQIEVEQQPATLLPGEEGKYTFKITNNGPDPILNVKIFHLLSNGTVVNLSTDQGKCWLGGTYALCNLKLIDPANSARITATVKAVRLPVRQQINVESTSRADPQPANNYLSVETAP